MNTQLILIEGLPGSGKTTTARMVSEILSEYGLKTKLFLEGNLDHPADFDGVAYFEKAHLEQLFGTNSHYEQIIKDRMNEFEEGLTIPYRKLINEWGTDLPDELQQQVFKNDIYELSFEQNRRLIVEKWNEFCQSYAYNSIYIFECCFIQNPLTIGTIKHNAVKEEVMNYVLQLEKAVKKLNPLLIYMDQPDVASTFYRAIQERPKEWSDRFIDYYTNQGLGKERGYKGVNGTVQVLKERRELELEIYDALQINKRMIDNSQYDDEKRKQRLVQIIKEFFG